MHSNKNYLLPASILLGATIIAFAWIYTTGLQASRSCATPPCSTGSSGERRGLDNAERAVELPAVWGNLGALMIRHGVIDRPQLEALYATRGGLSREEERLLENVPDGKLKVTQENSPFLLNLLWALGLSNKSKILEKGPVTDPRYGNSGQFASTGGFSLAKDNPMEHYNAHPFIVLTKEEESLVREVSKNIYRPCCDNSTYFPDCNHGMAMLGLLELLASQGVSEAEMYRAALTMNTLWFPNEYATIAKYLEFKGIAPQSVNPKEILGPTYSSASGYRRIVTLVPAEESQKSGSCGV